MDDESQLLFLTNVQKDTTQLSLPWNSTILETFFAY